MAAHDDNILCCEFAVEVGEFVDEAVVNVRTGYNRISTRLERITAARSSQA